MAYHAVGFLVADRDPTSRSTWMVDLRDRHPGRRHVLRPVRLPPGGQLAAPSAAPGPACGRRCASTPAAGPCGSCPPTGCRWPCSYRSRAPTLLQSADGLKRLALLGSVQQYVDRQLPGEVNLVYWSLTTEVHFYVLLPVLAYLLFRFRGRARPAGVPGRQRRLAAVDTGRRRREPDLRADRPVRGRHGRRRSGGRLRRRPARAASCAGCSPHRAFWLIVGVIVAAGIYQGGSHLSRTGPMTGLEFVHPIAGLAFAGLIARATCRARQPRRLGRPPGGGGRRQLQPLPVAHPHRRGRHGLHRPRRAGPHPGLMLFALGVLFAVTAAVSVMSFRWVEAPFLTAASRRSPSPSPSVSLLRP